MTNFQKDLKFVVQNFTDKIVNNLDKIPMIKDVIAAYFCLIDPDTPFPIKVAIVSTLVYLISPIDAIPDALPGGFADDAGVFIGILNLINDYITDDHRKQADKFLQDLKKRR